MFKPDNTSNEKICPLCQQNVTPGRFAGARDIEPAAVAFIQKEMPNWEPEQGVCPNCLQKVVTALGEQVATHPHRHALQTPFYGILPVGLRLGVNEEYDGTGVTIAFVDAGFSAHPDLEGRIKLYVDASTEDIRELEEVELSGDLSWHGTMTSVVACGNGSLSEGLYRGLATGAEVVLIRVSSPEGHINEEGIERGLSWLLAHGRRYGVQIVNVSLGGDKPIDFTQNPVDLTVEALVAQGILVVCAAGNDGNRWLVPPASAPSAITVGGLDDKNMLDLDTAELWHSNYGLTNRGVWKPEVVAPSLWLAAPVLQASQVAEMAQVLDELLELPAPELRERLAELESLPLVELPDPEQLADMTDEALYELLQNAWRSQKLLTPHYQHVDGTSFAAPIVSAVAAQMLQANPNLTPAGLKDLIMRTARYLPEISPDQQGHGVVDPWAAVQAAMATSKIGYRQPK